MLFLLSLASATSGFDPTTPAASFTGVETYTQDGSIRLWSAIERLEDPDHGFFHQEHFNDVTEWPRESEFAPWIDDCFGSQTPPSWKVLLHVGPSDPVAHGTPILFVPGAGDNGSRGFITLATHMDLLYRPVFVLTFAHPHGDVFMQAEMIADAIARIKARTGAAQVDLVSHSKGGIASAVYLSNLAGTVWPDSGYNSAGTRYRGDVRKAVFIATPLGGIDTSYRWPNQNLASTDADTAMAPTSWDSYGFTDLSDQDFLKDGQDLFPGHRQLLARQPYPLPGEQFASLGAYALQLDYYTTYEGGYGFYSHSDGIDAAIREGGSLIDSLPGIGVDPAVELYLMAGKNPLMPNGSEQYYTQSFGQVWTDLATSGTDAWGQVLAIITEDVLTGLSFSATDLQGLAAGKLVLGEITGESDGLVFTTSALDASALTARGAEVVATREADLSHLDLLYASPITGGLLQDAAAQDPLENGWMTGVGARYTAEDTIGQVEDWLADPENPDDTGEPTDDTGTGPTDDTGTQPQDDSATQDSDGVGNDSEADDGRDPGSCGCSSATPGAWGWLGLVAMGLLIRRR
jgi:triacylglycerol lipase